MAEQDATLPVQEEEPFAPSATGPSNTCAFCERLLDSDDTDNYREVVSWVNGPKLDGPKLREQTGRVAHKECVMKLVNGIAPDEGELF